MLLCCDCTDVMVTDVDVLCDCTDAVVVDAGVYVYSDEKEKIKTRETKQTVVQPWHYIWPSAVNLIHNTLYELICWLAVSLISH